MNPLDAMSDAFGWIQQALFEVLVQPVLFAAGGAHLLEQGYAGTQWFLWGLIQLGVLATLFHALERWRPVEPVIDDRAVRVDRLYAVIHRLGVFRLAMFFLLEPVGMSVAALFHGIGWTAWQVDAWWPGVTSHAWVSFVIYLILFDALEYFIHRAQHRYAWWWALHAVHHSQRQMTVWSDTRNHLLDDVIRSVLWAMVAQAVGVPPAQFVAVVVCTQLIESLSHANARIAWWGILEKVIVSPRFHRLHHAIGEGHESHGPGSLGGHNFGVLFAWWDHLLGTHSRLAELQPTGIRDQLPDHGHRDYGQGFWSQQVLGLVRMWQVCKPARVR